MRNQAVRVVVVPLLITVSAVGLAIAAGVGVGVVFGELADARHPPEEGQEWGNTLGSVMIGGLVGALVVVLGCTRGLVWASRRLFPPGRTAGAVWTALGVAVAGVVLGLAVAGVVGDGRTSAAEPVLAVALASPSIGFLLWHHHLVRVGRSRRPR